MNPELVRLQALGWAVPEADSEGVRWLEDQSARISYPREVLDTLAADGGGEGFWLDARGNAVGTLLKDAGVSTLWDVGAGTGVMTNRLSAFGVDVISIEPLPEGARAIAKMGAETFGGTLQDLELPDGSLPAVGLFDVVEHLEHPSELLAEVARVLQPGGTLVMTVPAYQWLWSAEDIELGHFRRYSTSTAREELKGTGLSVVAAAYLFATLVPAAALLRTLPYRLGRRKDSAAALERNVERLKPSSRVNNLANRIFSAEARIARNVPLPFGLTVLVVARRVASQ